MFPAARWRLRQVWPILITGCLGILSGAHGQSGSGPGVVDVVRSGMGDTITLRHTANRDSYYVLYGGDSVEAIGDPLFVSIGEGPVDSVMIGVQNSGQAFFRLVEISLSDPSDQDGDGRDDLSEMLAGSDPLVGNAPLPLAAHPGLAFPGASGEASVYSSSSPFIDLSFQVEVHLGGYRYHRRSGRFIQLVSIQNAGWRPLLDPLSALVHALAPGASLADPDGAVDTGGSSPDPFLNVPLPGVPSLGPGQAVTLTIQFENPSRNGIRYELHLVQFVTGSLADLDADGLPDEWELANGYDPEKADHPAAKLLVFTPLEND